MCIFCGVFFFPSWLCCPLRFQNSPHTRWWEGFLLFGKLSFMTPSPGWVSIPNSFFSLFVFYILSYHLSERMGCPSGYLVFSASVQKLFCGSCSAFKWSFDEFVGEKVVSPSYSSTILEPPPNFLRFYLGFWYLCSYMRFNHSFFLLFSFPFFLSSFPFFLSSFTSPFLSTLFVWYLYQGFARLKEGGEGDDRVWDGWMASPAWWTWVWVSSGSWWWTGKPGMLQSMGSQRIGHNGATELTDNRKRAGNNIFRSSWLV